MLIKTLILASLIGILGSAGLSQTAGFSLYRPFSFSPEWEEFRVEAPKSFKQNGKNDEKSSRLYYLSEVERYFFISSDPISSRLNFEIISRFAKDSGKTSIDIPEKVAVKYTYRFVDTDGYHNELSICRTFARVYIFQTTSRLRDDQKATKFTSSASCSKALQNPETIVIQDWMEPVGRAVPMGNKPQLASGEDRKIEPKTLDGVPRNSSLKIISQIRPAYTETARLYMVEGTVRLRVTFLATGKVGHIQPVSTLPFGLTGRAIAAATAFEFEPAYVNGFPVLTTKPVEFTFAIF